MTDIEIAQNHKLQPIQRIADTLQIPAEKLEAYGHYKAKVSLDMIKDKPQSNLILVSAINPTPAGEGKTTVSIGLADGLKLSGKKVALALREPSLGPVLGLKGGAAGGGYSQVVPMEDINLHFTGDIHAITTANNLLAAMIDNHIFQGNALGLDVRKIVWKRCMDMNDRELRNIIGGINGKNNGFPRQDGFNITAASEIMAILCLSSSIEDLKKRLGDIVIGYTYDDRLVRAREINAQGAMTALLLEAIKPNLVQSLGGVPAFVHGGPFANIAHGCNSVLATRMAMSLADYTVTEAGFGADLGAEKFLDIKCRKEGLAPAAVVLVATIRALKYNGGVKKEDLSTPDCEALKRGLPNLGKHIENITKVYGLNAVVAINKFLTDTDEEIAMVQQYAESLGVKAVVANVWAKGGEGALDLAAEVVSLCENPKPIRHPYELDMTIPEKIEALVTKIYGGSGVDYTPEALKTISDLDKNGFSGLPVCMAKTQYSLSDNPKALGAPKDFRVTVKELRLSAGAGFVVVVTGSIILMPGLPKKAAAELIDVDASGKITGLF